jgi:hypothetical protein
MFGKSIKRRIKMKDQINPRSFLSVAGMSLGIGVLYEFAPFLWHRAGAAAISDFFKTANGEGHKALRSPSSAIRTSVSRDHPTPSAPRPSKVRWN